LGLLLPPGFGYFPGFFKSCLVSMFLVFRSSLIVFFKNADSRFGHWFTLFN
jgi:hypothetical protein